MIIPMRMPTIEMISRAEDLLLWVFIDSAYFS